MKKMITVLVILIVFTFPIMVFADSYDFNDGEINIVVDESEWIVITSDNYKDFEEDLGEEYGEIEALFSTGSCSIMAVSTNENYYWTFGYSLQDQNVDFSSLDDESILSIFEDDLTNGNATASDIKTSIYETGGYKYLVADTIINEGDYTTGAVEYMTGVGKAFYIFVAYSNDGIRLTKKQKKEMKRLLNSVTYELEPAVESTNATGNSFLLRFGKRALYSFVIIALISLISLIWSLKKRNNEEIIEPEITIEKERTTESDSKKTVNEETNFNSEEDIQRVLADSEEQPSLDNAELLRSNSWTGQKPKTSERSVPFETKKGFDSDAIDHKVQAESKTESDIPEKQLRQLKQLYDAGVLTEEEFSEKKKKLLNL